MFRGVPRYDEYSPAGDWLSEIPSHWRWDPARTLFRERKEVGTGDEQLLSVTIGRGVISQAELLSSTSKKDSSNVDKSKYKLVLPGDLVYNKMRAWQGAAGLSSYRGIASPAYVVMTSRDGVAAYFHHVVRTPMFAKEAERWSYGITSDQWSLRPEHFKMIRFPVPPSNEQAAIVKYLAHANARIDKAIAAKRRLIILLKEQRGALLDELLNIRNQEWPIRRLKTLLTGIDQGVSPQADNQVPSADEWGVLKAGCVNYGRFRADQVKRLPEDFDVPVEHTIQAGDILVSRASGSPNLVGSAARVPVDPPRAILSDKIFRLRLREEVDPDFLVLLMNARDYREQVRAAISGAEGLANNLPVSSLRTFTFRIPPLNDQFEIVKVVEVESAGLRSATTRLEREIELLREFRTTLVADVVTGQLDVREIASSLPETDCVEPVVDELSDSLDLEVEDELETTEV